MMSLKKSPTCRLASTLLSLAFVANSFAAAALAQEAQRDRRVGQSPATSAAPSVAPSPTPQTRATPPPRATTAPASTITPPARSATPTPPARSATLAAALPPAR
jgi:hypothetical protein